MNPIRIALGCVTFGREIDEAASFALMDHALSRGATSFDTAAAYGGGASERIVGRWLASRRPTNVIVATKMLPPYEPERIAQCVDESRERLGVEHLDLFYLHQWHASAESVEALAALDAQVRAGKVRALGVSNFHHGQLTSVIRLQQTHGLSPMTAVQNNHNFAVRDVTDELRAFCAAHGISVVTYSPLGAGFLTGKHQPGVQPGSRFDLIPGHQAVYFHDESYRRLARLEAIAKRTGHPQAHLALAWALHQPGVSTVLVGGRTAAHLDQAFAALEFGDEEVMQQLSSEGG